MSVNVSVIVTTYNWPSALRLVLKSLVEQKTKESFEIIVADDGSTQETAELIRFFKENTTIPILHIWQEDRGFQAASIRNKASVAAQGKYLIFLDGDCIPREDFVERHRRLAKPGCFVAGNRVLLRQAYTLTVLANSPALHKRTLRQWFFSWLKGEVNRWGPFVILPWGSETKTYWQGAKGCNLAMWRADLLSINGWEEKFSGWGYEDSDLVIRLMRLGLKRRSGRFQVPVIHLWHRESDRSRKVHNWQLFNQRKDQFVLLAENGLQEYEEKYENSNA